MTDCKICKTRERHQYSSMCQHCIDTGWRANDDFTGYVNINEKQTVKNLKFKKITVKVRK